MTNPNEFLVKISIEPNDLTNMEHGFERISHTETVVEKGSVDINSMVEKMIEDYQA